MDERDRRLGMDKAISRRDFLSGVSVAIGASLLPRYAIAGQQESLFPAYYYPPAMTGMRGSHPGSFEVAHASVQGQKWPPGKSEEHYDLVVVGAGISGLSAAHIYLRDIKQDARILILDNHDDFGGHAKRNEFTLDGRSFIGYGGTMLIEAPGTYPVVAKQVMRELGIDTDRHREFYHEDLFSSHNLGRACFFDRETFGADVLATGKHGFADSIAELPLSSQAKSDLQRLFADEKDYLEGKGEDERQTVLDTYSWRRYLQEFAGLGEEALTFVQKWPHGVWAIGADAMPAWMARQEGYPGFGKTQASDEKNSKKDGVEAFYFPDGNASVARLLVRKLVPDVAPGNSMEDIVAARFDYSQLDRASNATRIRLNSTVVDMRHQGGKRDADVSVTYVNGGKSRTVSAGNVVWAGYYAMLPHVCPDLPEAQVAALENSVRAPLVYTNVLIRNWHSLARMGMQRAYCPGSVFQAVMFTHPVSIGDYRFSQSPDEPVILHMQHIPLAPGLPAAEQFRAGRRALLEMPFTTFERNIREQLYRMLGPGGFDPAEDIAGITVNRWPHGYAYSVDPESGDVAWWPDRWQQEKRSWIVARQRVGRIVFAGTDAASNAMTEAAIEEAHRAIHSMASEASG